MADAASGHGTGEQVASRQRPPTAFARGRADGSPPLLRGASVLTPLILLLTAAMFAVLLQAGLLTPPVRLLRTLETLGGALPEAVDTEAERSYGACGDVCTAAGACRHVQLSDGLHGGDRVSPEALLDARSCR